MGAFVTEALMGKVLPAPFSPLPIAGIGLPLALLPMKSLWKQSPGAFMDYQPKIQGSFLNTEGKKKKKQTKQPYSALFKLTTKVCGFGFLVYATAKKKKVLKLKCLSIFC